MGDTFLVAYATATDVRAVRFSRAAGLLDAPPGVLLAATVAEAGGVIATSDGERSIVAWREGRPAEAVVRVVRIAADGTVLDPTPLDVATTPRFSSLSVAAESASILVTYAESEESGATSVRAVLVPN